MSTKWILINVLLLAGCAALAWQLRTAVNRFHAENRIAGIQPRDLKQKAAQEPGLAPPVPARPHVAADFDVVPAKNLFSEFRAREEKVETPVVVETRELTVKPVLVGISIMGNQRLAAILDPASQSAGRKTQTKKLGDSYQGYIVTDITETTMVLESGTRREVIPLYDTAKRGQGGGKTAIQATRIVAFGGGAGGTVGAQASATIPASMAGSPQTRRPVVDGPPPQATAGSGVVGTQGGAVRTTPGVQTGGPARTAPGAQSPAPAWNEGTDNQGRRVIRTPFGDIVRDKPPSP